MKNLYDRIDILLKEKHFSQKDLAKEIGLSSAQTYAQWKLRNSMLGADIACKIAKYLNTTVEYLVTGNDTSPLESEIKNLQSKIDQIAKIINEK